MDITTCKPGTGSTVRFWKDKWHQTSPGIEFPHMFSFAKQQDISLKQLLEINENNLLDHFHLPLSMIAFQRSENLVVRLAEHDNHSTEDRWELSNNSRFSVNKVYALLNPVIKAPAPFTWIWKSCVQLKHKFFF